MPPKPLQFDLSLKGWGSARMILRRGKVEIGNLRLLILFTEQEPFP